jgi:hypothetical protein
MELRSVSAAAANHHYALEMEEEEEEASLLREVTTGGGTNNRSNGTANSSTLSTTGVSGFSKKVLLIMALALLVVLLVGRMSSSSSQGGEPGSEQSGLLVDVSHAGIVTKPPHPESPEKPQEADSSSPGGTTAVTADINPSTSTSVDDNVPKEEQPQSHSTPATSPKVKEKTTFVQTHPTNYRTNRIYSNISQIIPDPLQTAPMDADTKKELATKWGKWKFWDGDEAHRPKSTTIDICAAFEHCDVPASAWPDDSWQVDAVYVNHILNDADLLIARAMEAIYTEYGKGKPLPPEALFERAQMFHWDYIDLHDESTKSAPPKYAKRGNRGNGGWTTHRSFEGLVRRLLHAMMTNDAFTIVMGGHSAAAGHGNHFHQSYLMQMHRILAPIFARLGVPLVTRNLAQGGLGTLQNALGAGSLYGSEIDLLLWDSGMTEGSYEHLDLFMRQGVLGGNRVPVIWGGSYELLRMWHELVDLDVGEFGNAQDGIPTVTDETQALTLPYAARYMKCAPDRQDVCSNEPSFCSVCWIPRDDIADPKALFHSLADKPGGQVKWHPGWRTHQLVGRALAFSVLTALQSAVQIFSQQTLGGPPLDDYHWHVKDYYANIRQKLLNLDDANNHCLKNSAHMPTRMCTTPMQARTEFTPRANAQETSITSILKPAPNGYVPKNEQLPLYDGPDVQNPCFDIPPGSVDVLAVVSLRRQRQRALQTTAVKTKFSRDSSESSSIVAGTNDQSVDRAAERRRVTSDTGIEPGLGWQVIDQPAGQCDGEYNSYCGRGSNDYCPLLRHHDSRGALVGNEFAGWLVMDLPNVSAGIVVLKLVSYYPPEANTKTEGWTSVNNKDGQQRRLDESHQRRRREKDAATLDSLPETFQFEFSIDGKITTLSKDEFKDRVKKPQRVIELLTVLDDPNFTTTAKNVEVGIRMLGCGRACIMGLSHVYWA